jgi:hypothetical protein
MWHDFSCLANSFICVLSNWYYLSRALVTVFTVWAERVSIWRSLYRIVFTASLITGLPLFLILFYEFVFEVLSRRGILVIGRVGVMQSGGSHQSLCNHWCRPLYGAQSCVYAGLEYCRMAGAIGRSPCSYERVCRFSERFPRSSGHYCDLSNMDALLSIQHT